MHTLFSLIEAADNAGYMLDMVFAHSSDAEFFKHRRIVCPDVTMMSDAEIERLAKFADNCGKLIIIGRFGCLKPDGSARSFEEVLKIIRDSLRSQMNKEHLEKLFSYNVSNEKIWIARAVPLPLKNVAMKYVYTASALANTSTVTNIGNIPIEEPYRPYVEMILAFLAMSKGQDIKGTVCSYGETLAFSFSYTLKDVSIQRCFFRKLAADGIAVEIDSNGVNYE